MNNKSELSKLTINHSTDATKSILWIKNLNGLLIIRLRGLLDLEHTILATDNQYLFLFS